MFRKRSSDFQFACVHPRQCGGALVWRLARRLGLGSRCRAWTWAGIWLGLGLSIRLLPGTILLRATSATGLRLGARARLAQRALGVPPRVALLVTKTRREAGFPHHSEIPRRYFHSRTSTQCPAI